MGKLWSTMDSVYNKIVTLRQAVAGMSLSEDNLDHVDVIIDDLKEGFHSRMRILTGSQSRCSSLG